MHDCPGDTGNRAALTWLGHGTVLLEIDGVRLLTDPVLRERIGPLVRIAPALPPGAVGRVDAVLLSHLHNDHADAPSLREVARDVPVLAPPGAKRWLTRLGLREVHELRAGQERAVAGVRVTATAAAHGHVRRPFGPRSGAVGFVVGGTRSVYYAGDTDVFAAMADLRGSVDVALLPIWGWGPALGPGHMDPERAVAAAALIAPSVAVPVHWGTFALPRPLRGRGDPRSPALAFEALAARFAPHVEIRTLAPGEPIPLDITRFG